MTEHRSNAPFHDWVPRPLGILILLLMFVPPTFSGGAYLSNISEMAGSTGMWTEDIQLAAIFTSIGMCLFPPFMVRFLEARRVRETYIRCFALLIVLNLCCAVTTSLPVMLGACLLTGIVRIIVMLNCTFTIAPYVTGMDTLAMFTMTQEPPPHVQYGLERKRTMLMPLLYFYILIISQASNMVTAWFAWHYRWQDAYYAVVVMLAICIVVAICTMKDERKPVRYRFEWDMLADMLAMGVALCAMSYVLVYGKTLDWFHSGAIRLSTALSLLGTAVVVWRMAHHGVHRYLPLEIFSYRNVWMSVLLFLITMVFNSANIFVGTYAHLSTSVSNLHGAFLSRWAIVGCVLGFLLSIVLVLLKVRFRIIFVAGFLLMASANAYLYFQYQTMGLFSNLTLPVILNYTGLLMLYSLVAAFGMKSLPSRYLATFVFLMIWMRNAIAPVVGSSIYANWLNDRQQYHITRLAHDMESGNTAAVSAYSASRMMAQAAGKASLEAEQMAATVLRGRVAVQAAIVAMKEITGQTVILLLVTSVVVWFLPYHREETT